MVDLSELMRVIFPSQRASFADFSWARTETDTARTNIDAMNSQSSFFIMERLLLHTKIKALHGRKAQAQACYCMKHVSNFPQYVNKFFEQSPAHLLLHVGRRLLARAV